MPPQRKPVLSREDLKRINAALRVIHDNLPLLDQAENCGVDCEAFREQFRFYQDRLTRFKEQFFTNQRES